MPAASPGGLGGSREVKPSPGSGPGGGARGAVGPGAHCYAVSNEWAARRVRGGAVPRRGGEKNKPGVRTVVT